MHNTKVLNFLIKQKNAFPPPEWNPILNGKSFRPKHPFSRSIGTFFLPFLDKVLLGFGLQKWPKLELHWETKSHFSSKLPQFSWFYIFVSFNTCTLFENYSKCLICIFWFWHFPPIFVLFFKVTYLEKLFEHSFRFS